MLSSSTMRPKVRVSALVISLVLAMIPKNVDLDNLWTRKYNKVVVLARIIPIKIRAESTVELNKGVVPTKSCHRPRSKTPSEREMIVPIGIRA